MTYETRTAEFKARIDAGEKIEATDWMPDEYRTAALKFIEMHANSEVMGALPEREWIARAPSLRRKMSLTAKVQDEVGHGHMLYRVAEDLGKSRDAMIADLIDGRTKFHNVFHYPTYTWGDVAVIGFLIDGAALVTQKALLDCSYAPYVRVLKRICAEESLHQRHGEDLVLELAAAPRSSARCSRTPSTAGGSRSCTSSARPRRRARTRCCTGASRSTPTRSCASASSASTCPSSGTSASASPTPRCSSTRPRVSGPGREPNWDTFWQVVKGNGPMTETRLAWRRWMHEAHGWVREALATTPTAA